MIDYKTVCRVRVAGAVFTLLLVCPYKTSRRHSWILLLSASGPKYNRQRPPEAANWCPETSEGLLSGGGKATGMEGWPFLHPEQKQANYRITAGYRGREEVHLFQTARGSLLTHRAPSYPHSR